MPWKRVILLVWLILLLFLVGFWIISSRGDGGLLFGWEEKNLYGRAFAAAGSLELFVRDHDGFFDPEGIDWIFYPYDPADPGSKEQPPGIKTRLFGSFHYSRIVEVHPFGAEDVPDEPVGHHITLPFWFLTLLHTIFFALLYPFIHRRQQRPRLDLPDLRP